MTQGKKAYDLRSQGLSWEAIGKEIGKTTAAARTICFAYRKKNDLPNPSPDQTGPERLAVIRGHSPAHDMTHTVPEPYVVKGVSTYYNDEGKPVGQWVKSSLAHSEIVAIMRQVAGEIAEGIKPRPVVKLDSRWDQPEELLDFYTLTDGHFGLLSWNEETGEDWDLGIAEQTILDAFRYLIERSPPAKYGFFNQLGDAMHFDGLKPVTPTSGHALDADSRMHKVARCVTRVFEQIIEMLLKKHRHVTVLMAQGNHDMASSVWLQLFFKRLYRDNPRVEVIESPYPYYAKQHGRMLIGCHHGHGKKVEDLPDVFAREFRHLMGNTDHTVIHTGHLHHKYMKEHPHGTVEQHPTIAARSAYEAVNGYGAMRSMQCITYHKQHLETGRCVYNLPIKRGGA